MAAGTGTDNVLSEKPQAISEQEGYPDLITMHRVSPTRLDFTMGGMSQNEFALLPLEQQHLVHAIRYERVLIALHLSDEHRAHPLVRDMVVEMQKFAESDLLKPESYLMQLMDVGPHLQRKLPKRPPVLEIGNMPGKLDRLNVPVINANIKRVNELVISLIPNADAFIRFRMAIEECLVNHAKHGIGSDPRETIKIRSVMKHGRFGMAVKDNGWGYRPKLVRDPTLLENLAQPDGRGLFLMQAADRRFISHDGRLTVLTKRIEEN